MSVPATILSGPRLRPSLWTQIHSTRGSRETNPVDPMCPDAILIGIQVYPGSLRYPSKFQKKVQSRVSRGVAHHGAAQASRRHEAGQAAPHLPNRLDDCFDRHRVECDKGTSGLLLIRHGRHRAGRHSMQCHLHHQQQIGHIDFTVRRAGRINIQMLVIRRVGHEQSQYNPCHDHDITRIHAP
jgi:hypothetical protein